MPPPKKDPLLVAHSAVFLTKHEDYAAAAGARLCEASLTPQARVLVATESSPASERLRVALRRQPGTGLCWWLRDEATWLASWRSGDVMRFAAEDSVLQQIIQRGAQLLYRAVPELPPEALLVGAQHNMTRGWIEAIVQATRALGFDALQGNEVDRHAGPVQPTARPWLAVFNAAALTPPLWRP